MIDNVRNDLTRRADTARSEVEDMIWLLKMAVIGAFVGAIYTELRKRPEQRTWHGKLLGVIPYDFRMPSFDQLRQAYWNPHSPKIFTDRPVGVGWAVNIPTVLRRLGVRSEMTKGR
jgi:hypothetical protein